MVPKVDKGRKIKRRKTKGNKKNESMKRRFKIYRKWI